jgi:hypothetical protein
VKLSDHKAKRRRDELDAGAPTPTVEEYMAAGHDRENAEALVGLDVVCAARKAKLASLTPEQRKHLERFYRERNAEFARLTEARRARLRPGQAFDFTGEWANANHHAARVAARRTASRARGAGRPAVRVASSKRSSAESGDSGGESESDEPPGKRGLCASCNKDLPKGRRRYCSSRHADRDRQRRKRERDRQRSGVGLARPMRFRNDVHLGLVDEGWDRHRRDPYKDFDTELWSEKRLITLEDLKARAGCRCDGHHIELEPGACAKCGHWLPGGAVAA